MRTDDKQEQRYCIPIPSIYNLYITIYGGYIITKKDDFLMRLCYYPIKLFGLKPPLPPPPIIHQDFFMYFYIQGVGSIHRKAFHRRTFRRFQNHRQDKFIDRKFHRYAISQTGHSIDRTFHRQDIPQTGHSIDMTFHRQDIPQTGHSIDRTFHRQNISLIGHFIDMTFHRQDFLQTGHFIDRTFHRQDISKTEQIFHTPKNFQRLVISQ